MLISIILASQKLSLLNIYAPNNQTNQLEFMQELKKCIIGRTELTGFKIVGGDWNCQEKTNYAEQLGHQQIIEIWS